jgi:hypothetical protein
MGRGETAAGHLNKIFKLLGKIGPPLYQNGEVLMGDILDGLPRVKAKALEALFCQGDDGFVKFPENIERLPGEFRIGFFHIYRHAPSLSGE